MQKDVAIHELCKMSADERQALLRRAEDDLAPFIEKVAPIIADVKERGDQALIDYARKFDQADLSQSGLAATDEDFDRAYEQLDDELIEVLRYSADNIRHVRCAPTWTRPRDFPLR